MGGIAPDRSKRWTILARGRQGGGHPRERRDFEQSQRGCPTLREWQRLPPKRGSRDGLALALLL